jgi:hypothetical protein
MGDSSVEHVRCISPAWSPSSTPPQALRIPPPCSEIAHYPAVDDPWPEAILLLVTLLWRIEHLVFPRPALGLPVGSVPRGSSWMNFTLLEQGNGRIATSRPFIDTVAKDRDQQRAQGCNRCTRLQA